MIIYKDALSESQDELLTDSYKIEEIDGIIYRVKGKMKTESVDIDDALIGGNASAEGADADAGADPSAVSGIDVVMANRLVEFDIKKKDYVTHIKEYMTRVKAHLEDKPEEKAIFMSNVNKFVKEEIIGNFKEWGFYCGESMNPNGMLVLCKWITNDDNVDEPYLYYFKHGLEAEKC